MANDEGHWCFAWFAAAPTGSGTTKAGLQKSSKWRSGDRITVTFLEGDQRLKDRVRAVAEQWTAPGRANLKLAFVDDPNADIRISFRPGKGSWSTVGTTCRKVPNGQATMNFGWIDANSPELVLQSVVLHEFGHALGLIHEHQNPAGGFKWNRQAVIDDLSGPPNNWSISQIEFNVLNPVNAADLAATVMDPLSIMMYPIPARWTQDGRSTGSNKELSAKDKSFIKEQYV